MERQSRFTSCGSLNRVDYWLTVNNDCSVVINYLGYDFKMERRTVSDDWKLTFEDNTIYDDSACEDFYGDIEDVADIFVCRMTEGWRDEVEHVVCYKRVQALQGALFEWGAPATVLETEEDCIKAWKVIHNSGTWRSISKHKTPPSEWEDMLAKLGLEGHEEVQSICTFTNGCSGSYCYSHQWTPNL